MWFSHLSTPLGPRVRTNYNFILDVINPLKDESLINLSKTFSVKYLGLGIDDVVKLSYTDPDIVDVLMTSNEGSYVAVLASYYDVGR